MRHWRDSVSDMTFRTFLPHSNCWVELFNQTLKQRLMLASAEWKLDWDRVLHEVVAQYNRTIHDDTGIPLASFFVSHQPQLNTPTTKKFQRETSKNFKTFQEGDLVLRKIPIYKVGQLTKLAPKFDGPYRIVRKADSDVTFQLQRVSDNQLIPCGHISQLKKYYVPFGSEEKEIVQTETSKGGPPRPDRRAPAM